VVGKFLNHQADTAILPPVKSKFLSIILPSCKKQVPINEDIQKEKCGHCSYCHGGRVRIQTTTELPALSGFDFNKLTAEFTTAVEDAPSAVTVTKFLCGIYTPLFAKMKIKQLPHFGVLERYPFLEVKDWVGRYLH
jgi:hypothetical protein